MEQATIDSLLRASDAIVRVARPLKVADVVKQIRERTIKRTLKENNGKIPTWTKEYEEAESYNFNNSEDEEDAAEVEAAGNRSVFASDSELFPNEDLLTSGNDYEEMAEDDDESKSHQKIAKTILSSGDEQSLQHDEEEKDNHEDIESEDDREEAEGESVYVQQLADEVHQKLRRSAFVDEEAEEEGIEIRNDLEELAQEAKMTSAYIAEMKSLIDDREVVEDGASHPSLFAQQIVEESIEESELIVQILKDKKEARLTNLSLKKKYGRKSAALKQSQKQSMLFPIDIFQSIGTLHLLINSAEEEEEVEDFAMNEDTSDFLAWREQKTSLPSMSSLPSPKGLHSFSSQSFSTSLFSSSMGARKRSSEEILKRLNSLDPLSGAGGFSSSKIFNNKEL